MPIDPSIYGQIQQPQGPLDQYGKALNLRALMDESKLRQLQTTKLESDIGKENAVDQLFANAPAGATLESLLPDVYRTGGAARGVEMQGKLLTQQKTKADLEKTQLELTMKSAELHRDQLANVDSPEAAAQWVQAGYADPHIAPILNRGGTVEQAIARIPQDPAQFQDWKARNGMGIQKFLEMQNTNAQHALNRATSERGQDMSAQSAREGHALTERGQNMTDARQRELNGIMEGSTNTPSPSLVKGIASGEIELRAPPTNARNPVMLERYGKLLDAVKAENPNFSQEMYPTIKKTVGNFASGKEAATVKSLNTAIDHLGTLRELGDALKNGNMQVFNQIANTYAEQTGQAAPSNLTAAAQIIGNEVVKGITGGPGAEEDRKKAAAAFSNVKSPDQLAGAISTVEKLLGGQLKGMEQQYSAGTYGRKDFREKYLTPAAQKAFDTSKGTNTAATASPAGAVATVKNDDDFNKLPSGAVFVGPDGKQRRKP